MDHFYNGRAYESLSALSSSHALGLPCNGCILLSFFFHKGSLVDQKFIKERWVLNQTNSTSFCHDDTRQTGPEDQTSTCLHHSLRKVIGPQPRLETPNAKTEGMVINFTFRSTVVYSMAF